jgi:hypothetical protein
MHVHHVMRDEPSNKAFTRFILLLLQVGAAQFKLM